MKLGCGIAFCFLFLIFFSSTFNSVLEDKFDMLMGKNTIYFSALTQPTAKPWCHDSKSAYTLARSLYGKYSLESNWRFECLKIPKIIHQIWLGGELPEKYVNWVNSWDKYNPNWLHILWTDHDLKYLNLMNKKLFDKAKNYGEKSDILRLELIDMFGGLYVDTDYECLKPFDELHYCNSFYVSAINAGGCGFGTNNALIGAAFEHPLSHKLVQALEGSKSFPDLSNRTGPIFFTRTLAQNLEFYSDNLTIYPPCYFTPDPSNPKDAYAIHWFDASWGRSLTKEKRIKKDYTLEKVFTPKYLKRLLLRKNRGDYNSHDSYKEIWHFVSRKLLRKSVTELGLIDFKMNSDVPHHCHYTGITPVKFLALERRLTDHFDENKTYLWQDWTHEKLQPCELLMVGDVMEELPLEYCKSLLHTIKNSNVEYFISAHDPNACNTDIALGNSRSLNLCKAPFNLTAPEKIFFVKKRSYGLWKNKR